MFLLAQIQLHDHPSVFGVAEVLFAIAAELSVCLCHIAAQRLLKLLRYAAPRDHIAHAGVQYFVDIEAELFAPKSDFDGVPAGSQEKGQVLLHKLQ